jgi:hypothetical protein
MGQNDRTHSRVATAWEQSATEDKINLLANSF